MKPVSVSIDVPQAPVEVYDFLSPMANHERFTDHLLQDWRYAGPAQGVGSKAAVSTRVGGRTDDIEIEVVSVEPNRRIVERNVGAKGKRVANGTYVLDSLPDGGTRVTFTYAWKSAPIAERLLAPVARSVLRRGNETALRRLADLLAHDEAAPKAIPQR
jgi:hypothetical protein